MSWTHHLPRSRSRCYTTSHQRQRRKFQSEFETLNSTLEFHVQQQTNNQHAYLRLLTLLTMHILHTLLTHILLIAAGHTTSSPPASSPSRRRNSTRKPMPFFVTPGTQGTCLLRAGDCHWIEFLRRSSGTSLTHRRNAGRISNSIT